MLRPENPRLPYPGLRPFEPHEVDLFFGREQHVDALLDRLSRSHFVAVAGESGAGKSSLVRAGLLPALEAGFVVEAGSDWRVAMMRPGGAPLGALADAVLAPGVLSQAGGMPRCEIALAELRRGPLGLVQLVRDAHLNRHTNTLVVVDQFEELFRYCREPAQRDQANVLVELLLRASEQREVPIFVVLTMRSDFVGECARFRGLPERLNDNQYLTPRLTREQIAQAIREPARVCGGVVESALVDELCNAVGDNQDQLPLLQHLLMRSWERASAESNPPRLTPELARQMGGLHSALNNHAQQVYESLPSAERRAIARAMFKRLTDPHGQRRDLRRDALVSEVAAVAAVPVEAAIAVADEFRAEGRHMLTPPPPIPLDANSRLDISHESLLRQWSSLNEWAREEGACAHAFQRLREEAQREGEQKGELLSGRDLAGAQDWMKQAEPTKAWAERYAPAGALDATLAFIRKSETQAKLRKDEELRAADRAAAAKRQKYYTFGAVALASVVAIVAMAIFGLYEEAKAQGAEATRQSQEAEKQRDGAHRLFEEATTQATLAATNAKRAAENESEARNQRGIVETQNTELARERVEAHARQLAANAQLESHNDPALAVLLARKAVQENNSDEWAVRALRAAIADHVPSVESTFEVAKSRNYIPQTNKAGWLDFSLYESSLSSRDDWAIIPSGKNAIIWSTVTGEEIRTLAGDAGHARIVGSAIFSPDGRLAVTSSADTTARVWNASTGKLVGEPLPHNSMVNNAVFNRDGTLLVTLEDDNRARVWNVGDSSLRCDLNLEGAKHNFITASFSDDQNLLVTVTVTHAEVSSWQAQVWNVARDRCPRESVPEIQKIRNLRWASFSGSGPWLGVVTVKGEVIVLNSSYWTVKRRIDPVVSYTPDERPFPPPEVFPPPIAWSSDGYFAFAGGDHVVRVAAVDRSDAPVELHGHMGNVTGISFHPTGDRLLTTSADGTGRVWRLRADKQPLEVLILKGHRDAVGSGAFSRNGEIVTASNDGRVRSWKPRFALREKQFPGLRAASYSGDGTQIWVAGTDPGRPLLWISELVTGTLTPRKDFKDRTSSPVFHGRRVIETSDKSGVSFRDVREPSKSSLLPESDGLLPLPGTSPDGRFVFAHAGKVVKVWDLDEPQAPPTVRRSPGGEDGLCEGKAISNDMRLAWYCAEQDRILITRAGRPQPMRIDIGEKTKVKDVRFGTTGRWLAVTFEDNSSLELLDTERRKTHSTVRGDDRAITAVAFSPDDSFIASASEDSTVRVWDVKSGAGIAAFAATGLRRLTGAAFSPDGLSLLLVAAPDRLLLWRCYACGDRLALLKEVRERKIHRTLSEEQERRFGIESRELNSDGRHRSDHPHRRF